MYIGVVIVNIHHKVQGLQQLHDDTEKYTEQVLLGQPKGWSAQLVRRCVVGTANNGERRPKALMQQYNVGRP